MERVDMGMRIAGIQPGYLPWLGYFDQMLRVDAFLVADELAYSSSGWTRRNRVKGPRGAVWLTLPARAQDGQLIRDVSLDADAAWRRKHAATLRHLYARGVDVEDAVAGFERAVGAAPDTLAGAATATIRWLAERLDVQTPILVSSELGLEARYRARFPDHPGPNHRIVAYLEALGADELLEGETGRAYIDEALFASFGRRVRFHDYVHPVYPQLHGPFVSHLSAIDLLLCAGVEPARRMLRTGRLRDGD
jgi:hypothetical protein